MMVDFAELGDVAQDLVLTLRQYPAPLLKNLYDYVPKVTGHKRSPPTIRMALQRHCRKSPWYTGKFDLFERIDNGCWQLRPGLKFKV